MRSSNATRNVRLILMLSVVVVRFIDIRWTGCCVFFCSLMIGDGLIDEEMMISSILIIIKRAYTHDQYENAFMSNAHCPLLIRIGNIQFNLLNGRIVIATLDDITDHIQLPWVYVRNQMGI